jgi:hypothetical protein
MSAKTYTIRFPNDMDQWDWEDARDRKGLAGASVLFSDGNTVELYFESERSVIRSLDALNSRPCCWFNSKLIVLKEVTKAEIELAVEYLNSVGYFENKGSRKPT